jgi:hypothetical protein
MTSEMMQQINTIKMQFGAGEPYHGAIKGCRRAPIYAQHVYHKPATAKI